MTCTGAPWVSPGGGATGREGEADFVIVGPDLGVVVVEIKGGRVGRDEGGWFSIDRHDRRHPIKNPFEQAQQSKHQPLAFLKGHPDISSLWLPMSHCVCFPDVLKRDLPHLPEAPAGLAITSEDLNTDLGKAIRMVAKQFSNESAPLSVGASGRIADLLKPNFEMPGRWSVVAQQQRPLLDRLTA